MVNKKIIFLAAGIIFFIFLAIFIAATPFKYALRMLPWAEHERIVLSLPFAPEDDAIGISPAGELLYHEGDLGHCGLDFGFDHNAKIIASVDGTVHSIKKVNENWDIIAVTGDYYVGYTKLEDYNLSLRKGSKIIRGSFIGHPQDKNVGKDTGSKQKDYAIHYEFGSSLALFMPWLERLCPYTYFDESSKERIDLIWENDKWPYKEIYPDICSGGYKGRDTLEDARRLDKLGYRKTFNMTLDRERAKAIDDRINLEENKNKDLDKNILIK